MESSYVSNQLLKNKYGLDTSTEVKTAALRTRQRTGEWPKRDPLSRIQNYLNRFHEIIDSGCPERKEHNLELIKGRFYDRYVIKPDQIPEGYFENQKRLAREQGHGDIEITPQMRGQLTEVIIADQRSSLGKWIDYLSSPDALYSDSLKYFTLRSVVNMAEYDKENKIYPQRSKGTTKPFPDRNGEALAYVLDAVEKKYKGERVVGDQEFEKLLAGENFAKLYAWAIEKITPASEEELSATKGEWVKYNKGSDHMLLAKSLQGHGTGWCTAGESTAQASLQAGDFYVYYSYDKDGKPTVPRIAIRMEGNSIAEVRGIAKEQNLDAGAIAVIEEKLKEFPDGESYKKKVADMRRLTAIENQIREGQSLTAQDLVFLYEIDAPIDGFGSDEDPRIKEVRGKRNPEEDMSIVFGFDKNQIAHNAGEIKKDTKAYLGPLIPGIFDKLSSSLEYIYTTFPEGRIKRETISIGGKTSEELKEELQRRNIEIDSSVEDIMDNKDFVTLKTSQNINLVRLKVKDLGFKHWQTTTSEASAHAEALALDLCPAEVGPWYRLSYTDQPMYEKLYITMKGTAFGRFDQPCGFMLDRSEWYGMGLERAWDSPVSWVNLEDELVFSLRPPAGEASKVT